VLSVRGGGKAISKQISLLNTKIFLANISGAKFNFPAELPNPSEVGGGGGSCDKEGPAI
jgi:hypothetical protein